METKVTTYHPHIDGLRALAVLLVFLFHLNPDFFPMGYIGVDVFFVISGFVITQSLYGEYLKTGTIKIGQFYVRRFKRLYPALVTMVSVTTVLYFLFGYLWNTNVLLKSSITSILAVSNLFYLKQATDYFQKELTNPLLHTWSLGIEEQFYVIYPLVLFLLLYLFKRLRYSVIYLGLIFLFLSVLLYVTSVHYQDVLWGNFYWPFARFWELGAGCALFFFSRFYPKVVAGQLIAALCMSMLLWIQFFGTDVSNQKSILLCVVLASAGIIYTGIYAQTPVIRMLQWSPMVYIGTISYSLYLWHLPAIYFLNLYASPVLYYLLTPLLTVLCAYVSYTYIETPLRHTQWFSKKWLVRGSVFGICLVLCTLTLVGPRALVKSTNAAINVVIADTKAINYIERHHQLGSRVQPVYTLGPNFDSVYCNDDSVGYSLNEHGLRTQCLIDKKSDTLLYITGDSHATHFFPLLSITKIPSDIYYNRFHREAIVRWIGSPLEMKTEERLTQRAEELAKLSLKYETIYYITSLYLSNANNQEETIRKNLGLYVEAMAPYSEVILVAPTPVWKSGPESCVLLQINCMLDQKADKAQRAVVLTIMQELARNNSKVHIYDPSEEICPTEQCSIYDFKNDFLWYQDDDHLSIEGSLALTPHFEYWFATEFSK